MGLTSMIVEYRRVPLLGAALRRVGYAMGFDCPASIEVGERLSIEHRGIGTVLHPRAKIGNDVRIYHHVTIGRQRLDGEYPGDTYIGDGAILCTGAVILTGTSDRHIGARAVIGANSVVTKDVPAGEVWAGNPAKKVGIRNWG
jgi:serine O-acetyltransferase